MVAVIATTIGTPIGAAAGHTSGQLGIDALLMRFTDLDPRSVPRPGHRCWCLANKLSERLPGTGSGSRSIPFPRCSGPYLARLVRGADSCRCGKRSSSRPRTRSAPATAPHHPLAHDPERGRADRSSNAPRLTVANADPGRGRAVLPRPGHLSRPEVRRSASSIGQQVQDVRFDDAAVAVLLPSGIPDCDHPRYQLHR